MSLGISAHCEALEDTVAEVPRNFHNVEFAKALGFFQSEYDAESIVKRVDLAKILCNVCFGDKKFEYMGIGSFTDISEADSKHIIPVVNLGLMNGVSATEFAPEENVTYIQLLKTVISLLGYDAYAINKGGYPNGYYAQATQLKLTVNPPSNMNYAVTMEKVAEVLKLAVNVDMNQVDKYSEDEISYEETEGLTYLKYYRGIDYDIGVINGNYVTDLTDGETTKYNEVKVNAFIYTLTENSKNIKDFLGYEAEVFYKQNSDRQRELLYYFISEHNTVTEISRENIIGFYQNKIEYINSDKKIKSLKINYATHVVYNGTLVPNYDADTINPFEGTYKDGKLKLIENNADAVIDFVFIEAYDTHVVSSVTEDKIYSKYRTSGVLDISEHHNNPIEILNVLGHPLRISDIAENDCLSVFEDIDGNIKKIIVTIDILYGEITYLEYESNVPKVIGINGTNYSCSPCLYLNNDLPKIAIGRKVEVYFNKDTLVSDVNARDFKSSDIGYLVSVGKESGLSGKYMLKIFTTGGKMKEYVLADKISLENIGSTINTKEALGYLGYVENSNDANMQPILYSTNKDGLIIWLHYCDSQDSTSNGFYNYPGFDGQTDIKDHYRISSKSFGSKLLLGNATVFFSVPDELNRYNDSFYKIKSILSVEEGINHPKYEAYGTKAYNPIAEILVEKGKTSGAITIDAKSDVFIVSNVRYRVDEEGNSGLSVSGYQLGKEYDYFANEGVLNVGPEGSQVDTGDIIRVSKDANGFINYCEFVFDASSKHLNSARNPSMESFYSAPRYSYGTVVYSDESSFSISIPLSDGTSITQCYPYSGFSVYVVEKLGRNNITVRKGVPKDIISDTMYPGEGSKLFVHTSYGDNKTLVVYKN